MVGGSKDEANFSYKLSLTDSQVLRISKAFTNALPANIKSSKTQLSMMVK